MEFSPKKPGSMIITLSAVLFFTMFKEAYEDYFRHKKDQLINASKARKVVKSGIKELQFQEVRVGYILQVKESETFPADMMLLACADQRGVAFIKTMNLGGEANLKERIAHESTRSLRSPGVHWSSVTARTIGFNGMFDSRPDLHFPLGVSSASSSMRGLEVTCRHCRSGHVSR